MPIRSWRATPRPRTHVNAMATIQMPTATSAGSWIHATSTGVATATKPSGTETGTDRDQRALAKESRQALNMSGSSSPDRCATTVGTTTATEAAISGTLGAKAQTPKAATGTAARMRSPAEDGWVIAATRPNASEKRGRTRRRSSASNQTSLDAPATRRLYCAELVFHIVAPDCGDSPMKHE